MEPQTVITRRIAQRSLQVARRGTEIEDAHTAPLPKKSCHQVLPDKPTAARNKRLHYHPWPHFVSGALSLACSDKTAARSRRKPSVTMLCNDEHWAHEHMQRIVKQRRPSPFEKGVPDNLQ